MAFKREVPNHPKYSTDAGINAEIESYLKGNINEEFNGFVFKYWRGDLWDFVPTYKPKDSFKMRDLKIIDGL